MTNKTNLGYIALAIMALGAALLLVSRDNQELVWDFIKKVITTEQGPEPDPLPEDQGGDESGLTETDTGSGPELRLFDFAQGGLGVQWPVACWTEGCQQLVRVEGLVPISTKVLVVDRSTDTIILEVTPTEANHVEFTLTGPGHWWVIPAMTGR